MDEKCFFECKMTRKPKMEGATSVAPSMLNRVWTMGYSLFPRMLSRWMKRLMKSR